MIEDKIEELIVALKENTAIQQSVIDTLKGQKPTAAAKKPAAKTTTAAAKKPAAKKPAAKKAPTEAAFVKKFSDYIKASADKEEVEERKDQARAITGYFGAEGLTSVKEGHRTEALGYLQQYMDGETPDFDSSEEEEEEEISADDIL